MSFFKHDDIETYYICKGEGKPLVLICGLGSQLTSWNFLIPFLKEKMKVIALDNRGTGKSSRPNYPYRMELFVQDIYKLLQHLEITEKIHLCGISMGGMIAQNFTLKYPKKVKTLILIATSANYDAKPIIESQKLMDNMTIEQKFQTRIPAQYGRKFRKILKGNKELYEILRDQFIEDATTLQDFINQGVATSAHDTRNDLNRINQPTLIVVGDKDRIIPGLNHSKFLHKNISNSTLKIIKGGGHSLQIDSSKELREIMWDFLKTHLNT
ncbi:MAG: alpha/beta fold hydrolase [Candidatus Lokiarchaeota archaeon]|nr:alpha/beta fold hydrolase [Candidatus Lokiarchaeota archaeon]MBD3339367.1 alpha/beta fold hydrolase [Candidatus Lokiarchaeota archaeon]